MLRYKEDYKVVIWMIITTGLLVINWLQPEFNWFTFLWACLMAVSVSTITHNHNHLRVWTNKWLNYFQDYWLTLFYGFPVFAWIPTHNKNHHKFNNKEGDYTITYRVSERNNLLTLLSYPTISSYWQQFAIKDFLKRNFDKNRKRFWYYISQYVVLGLWIGAALLIDWQKALLYIVLPQQVALFTVLVFNYLQHVGADELSKWEHSRDMVSPIFNVFVFNNGYHTVHHDHPGVHWSKCPEEHEKIKDNLNPVLVEHSFWWFLIRTYLLAPFIPALRRPNLRLERMRREQTSTESGMDAELAAAE